MLYYPWRSEDSLLGSEQTYGSKFYDSEVHTTVEQNEQDLNLMQMLSQRH